MMIMMTKFLTSWKAFPWKWKSRMNKKLTIFIFKKIATVNIEFLWTEPGIRAVYTVLFWMWGYLSESNVKVHRHLHINKKPPSVAQYYKDVIKIMVLLDYQLSIQLLFCKTGQDRLHKRLGNDMNSLPWNRGVFKGHIPSGGECGTLRGLLAQHC